MREYKIIKTDYTGKHSLGMSFAAKEKRSSRLQQLQKSIVDRAASLFRSKEKSVNKKAMASGVKARMQRVSDMLKRSFRTREARA